MKLRSLLFVPADRPDRFAKAVSSGADAIILDLEDAVAPARKSFARTAVADWLSGPSATPTFVRINALDSGLADADLAALSRNSPACVMLPKARGDASLVELDRLFADRNVPILPIAAEMPDAIFHLASFSNVAHRLAGLTWGVEDLSSAIGASARLADGNLTSPYELVRGLLLFAAHAAGVPAIETVFADIRDMAGLARQASRARSDGFAGMMAIHPAQVAIINENFTPSPEELDAARAVVEAFAANPAVGALNLDGRMIDRPHFVRAQRLLSAFA